MKRLLNYFSVILLVFSLFPPHLTLAEPTTEQEYEPEEIVLLSDHLNTEIYFYETIDAIINDEPTFAIPDDTIVELLTYPKLDEDIDDEIKVLLEQYSYIYYNNPIDEDDIVSGSENSTDDSSDDNGDLHKHSFEGWVHNDYIFSNDEADEYRKQRLHDHLEETDTNSYEELEQDNTREDNEAKEEVEEQAKPSSEETISTSMTGLALKQPVHVYENTDRNSKILKSYNYGHELKFRSYSDEWYSARVKINGKYEPGFIHVSDVGEKEDASSMYGVALKGSTNVYSEMNRDSNILKSYNKGHILKYKAHSKGWFSAVVFINGKRHSGFINAKDVESSITNPETLYGPGIKQPTSIYQRANTSSKVLKTYQYGAYLKFKEFTKDWYQVTVKVKGEWETGYLRKTDTGSMDHALNGFAQTDPTHVYSERSRQSKSLKNYNIGSKLKYRPYNKDWYRATVRVNGVWEHGYIYAKDVGAKEPTIRGYAAKYTTPVYASRSKSSNILKSYRQGAPLKYKYYNKNWYSATVINNGKRQNGFIHADDVSKKAPSLYGYAHQSPTYVYAKNSKSSKKLKSYKKGSKLKYRYYNKNWYIATVFIKGKKHTGYIHANDVGFTKQSNVVNPYRTYSYNNMVNDIIKLQEMYPDLIQYKVVGKTDYGRDIYVVGLGKGKASTFINGSLHAREWISTILNMYMIENYAKSYRYNNKIKGLNTRSILNNTTIWFMPMANPDGVTLQQQGLNAFPKKDHAKLIKYNRGSRNFKRWKANANGVDINRNFSVHWSTQNGPSSPDYMNYRGPRAHSEKETQAVVNFVKEIRPQMTINYHSSGEVIYWKYRQSKANMNRDYKIARGISNLTGYGLREPHNGKKGQVSGGGFLQYFTETYKLPSITPELGEYAGETNVTPSKSNFNRVWTQNRGVGLYAAQESYKLYK